MCSNGENSVRHFDVEVAASGDSDIAIRTAPEYLEAYARFVCKNRCIGCCIPNTEDDDGWRAFEDTMGTWDRCQEGLHRIFAQIPSLHQGQDGCPACAVARSFCVFHRVAELSRPRPLKVIKYSELAPDAAHLGLVEISYPCHAVDLGLFDDTQLNIRLAAMRRLSIAAIPGLSREVIEATEKEFLPGQRIVHQVDQLYSAALDRQAAVVKVAAIVAAAAEMDRQKKALSRRKPRTKRGRPPVKDAGRRGLLLAKYRLRGSGVTMKAFCDQNGVTQVEMKIYLNWYRSRKRRKAHKSRSSTQ